MTSGAAATARMSSLGRIDERMDELLAAREAHYERKRQGALRRWARERARTSSTPDVADQQVGNPSRVPKLSR